MHGATRNHREGERSALAEKITQFCAQKNPHRSYLNCKGFSDPANRRRPIPRSFYILAVLTPLVNFLTLYGPRVPRNMICSIGPVAPRLSCNVILACTCSTLISSPSSTPSGGPHFSISFANACNFFSCSRAAPSPSPLYLQR